VQRLEVRATNIAPLIQNMRPLLKNVLGPGIEKRFDLDEEMLPVLADPTQVEVAVLNLAINARDAMPTGGVLSFTSRLMESAGDPELDDGRYIELCISDTGAGMPADVRERAFEPFFTTKEVGKGTGLGLSMVYGMARQSGGIARIESEPGKGTDRKPLFQGGGRPTRAIIYASGFGRARRGSSAWRGENPCHRRRSGRSQFHQREPRRAWLQRLPGE
jgi:signal transduction histidine kinase